MIKNKRVSPEIGIGVFTIPEAAIILEIPSYKINRWIGSYWKFKSHKEDVYSWGEGKERGFNFYTLIELIIVKSFREIGVPFPKIKLAHDILFDILKIPYPFAHSKLLSDGKNIFLEENSTLLGLNKKKQSAFIDIISPYCKKIDFSNDNMAERYWPLGKTHSIIVDPNHSFGQPTIIGTNIPVFSLLKFIQAGESKEFISKAYHLNLNHIEDVILFSRRMAA